MNARIGEMYDPFNSVADIDNRYKSKSERY
jgi:hypothetical protein